MTFFCIISSLEVFGVVPNYEEDHENNAVMPVID